MKISLIVCSRNRADWLFECIKSALEYNKSNDEIIVVDQSTDYSSAKLLYKFYTGQKIKYIKTQTKGLSVARNIGLRNAKGDIIAYTDDDCLLTSNFFESLREEFNRHKDIAGVTGKTLPYLESNQNSKVQFLNAVKQDSEYRVFNSFVPLHLIGNGNNMAFRREVFFKVGVFDELLGVGGPLLSAEDMDFFYRMLKAGMKILYSPRVVLYHRQHRDNIESLKANFMYWAGKAAMFEKFFFDKDIRKYFFENIYREFKILGYKVIFQKKFKFILNLFMNPFAVSCGILKSVYYRKIWRK